MIGNYLFFCLIGISAYFFASTVARNAIVGGKKAGIGQFPYQVYVRLHDIYCGGGIIGNRHILTAAHCVVNRSDGKVKHERIIVLAGMNDLHKHAVSFEVKKIFVPKEYVPLFGVNFADIAVLKLNQALGLWKSKNMKRLELPKSVHENYRDEKANIAGFGWEWIKVNGNMEDGGNNDGHLRFAVADILSQCHEGHVDPEVVEKLLCARVRQYDNKTRGVCVGDSGGPLVHNGQTVIGILAGSPFGCSEKDSTAIYTRVSRYVDFIHNAMLDKKHKDISTLELSFHL